MKAMILAAGFGTRLRPFTAHTPKPLFPVGGRPLLDLMIASLEQAGCREIIINTHHLHRQIETYIAGRNNAIPVTTRFEPRILGTGGAIKNAADFWDGRPFMVVNSDIVTDIPLRAVYDAHLRHRHPATMVLVDDRAFNTVSVDAREFVRALDERLPDTQTPGYRRLTFTGIQVLDPAILDLIPENEPSGSIAMYQKLMAAGQKIKAFVPPRYSWTDIGTPGRYHAAVFAAAAPAAFQKAFPAPAAGPISRSALAGDGSDRRWYRLSSGGRTLIMADHGIRKHPGMAEVDSFIAIGRHLRRQNVSVPEILSHDAFCGLVFLEDLGDTHLQTLVRRTRALKELHGIYRSVIDLLISLSVNGARGFQAAWTFQSAVYDPELIVERECRYFLEAYLVGVLKQKVCYEELAREFGLLAHAAVEAGINGFMHRDFQSRNIMVRGGRYYAIDFQGGRTGPIQYDLASLLIDPYVQLPQPLQSDLVDYCMQALSRYRTVDPQAFFRGYRYCALTRNLQILGAFGYLSRIRQKHAFGQYIPAAVRTLKKGFSHLDSGRFPRLRSIVESLTP